MYPYIASQKMVNMAMSFNSHEVTDKNKLAPFYGPQCISSVSQRVYFIRYFAFIKF